VLLPHVADGVVNVVLHVVDVVDVAVVVLQEVDTLMKMVSTLSFRGLTGVAFKDREEVLANREKEVLDSGSGSRGRPRREFDRHSATGRVYCILVVASLMM
jgi:hypothetical protein